MAREAEKQESERTLLADFRDYGISIRLLPSGKRIDPNDFYQSRAQWESKGRLPGVVR